MSKLNLFSIVLVLSSVCFAQEDGIRIWEKHGLTSTEWRIAQDNGVSVETLDTLTSMGIHVTEYLESPWLKIGITRSQWFEYRSVGINDSAIVKLNTKQTDTTISKLDLSTDLNPEKKSALGLIPGYCQIKTGRKQLGAAQIIVAGTGVAGMVACAFIKPAAVPIPFLVMVVPVIPWSFATQR